MKKRNKVKGGHTIIDYVIQSKSHVLLEKVGQSYACRNQVVLLLSALQVGVYRKKISMQFRS